MAIATLEAAEEVPPKSAELRYTLGWFYYHRARLALNDQLFDEYELGLARAVDEWTVSLRVNPRSPVPHRMMGIAALFYGDLKSALSSFENSLRLRPKSGMGLAMLAQVCVYDGNLETAQKLLNKAERLEAYPAIVRLARALAEWYKGDTAQARYYFERGDAVDPRVGQMWNEMWNTTLPSPPLRAFEDFTAQCCSSLGCGPYLEAACEELQLTVPHRQTPAATVYQERVIEMKRRSIVNQIYQSRPDFQLKVDPVEAP